MVPQCQGVLHFVEDNDVGKYPDDDIRTVVLLGFFESVDPHVVSFDQVQRFAGFEVGLMHRGVHSSDILEASRALYVEKKHSQVEPFKIRWIYNVHSPNYWLLRLILP